MFVVLKTNLSHVTIVNKNMTKPNEINGNSNEQMTVVPNHDLNIHHFAHRDVVLRLLL